MSVYDKELIINGQAVRSPEQQVYKNMKDIEELKSQIEKWYASSVALNNTDTTIARTNTNVPDDVNGGLLIDPNGLMFSIEGGNETTLLIKYYSNIKGEQGEPGQDGEPGSSSNDKGSYITHTQPTLVDGNLTLSTENVDNISPDNIPIRVNDLIIYIDSNDQPTSIYTVTSVSGTTLILQKEGDYAKGGTLYAHYIRIRTVYGVVKRCGITIINSDSTAFTLSSLALWLYNKGYTGSPATAVCPTMGVWYENNAMAGMIDAIGSNDGTSIWMRTNTVGNATSYTTAEAVDDYTPILIS